MLGEKEDTFKKANNIILDLVSMAGLMLPEEEPRDVGAVQRTRGEGERDLPRFHPLPHMDPGTIAKDIRPAEFREWIQKFTSFIEDSTRGTPTWDIFVKTFMSKTNVMTKIGGMRCTTILPRGVKWSGDQEQ